MSTSRDFLLVMGGGAFGSGARYGTQLVAARWLGTSFPFGTLTVNVVGSALLAAMVVLSAGEAGALSEKGRLLLGTGVMGGFTTYSAFNSELLDLGLRGEWAKGALYLFATVVLCLVGSLAGYALARAAL